MLKRFLFVVVIMSVVSLGFAGGIALSGVGTRAKAMGGAMRGLADDASAMYWNPAGLSFLNETTITAGIHYVDFGGEYKMFMGDTYENDDLLNLIPSVVYANSRSDRKWDWGVGIYVPFGLSAEWDIFQLPEDFNGNPVTWPDGFEENEIYGSLMVIDFHPTFSYKFTDKLSAGLGISMDYASIELTKVKLHEGPTPEESLGANLPTFFQMEGTGFAYGANYGLMFKPTNCLSLGVSGRLKSELVLEGDAQIDTYVNSIVATFVNPAGPIPSDIYSANPDAEASLYLPADMGAGLGYKINENWLVSADFTYTWWEAVDVITIDFEEGHTILGKPVEDEEMVLEWSNTIRFGLGTEYLMNSWAFRAGYYYDESPLNDETMTVIFPDFSTKHALNGGFGYMITENICLDLAIEYIMFEEREVEYDPTNHENMPGTYNASLMDIMLDLTWKF